MGIRDLNFQPGEIHNGELRNMSYFRYSARYQSETND